MAVAMVTTAPVNGIDIFLEISTDNGTTYKKVVCLIKQGIDKSRGNNETETQCGTIVGKGSLKQSIPIEGAVNDVLTAEQVNYLSYTQLDAIITDGTAVMVKIKHPADTGAVVNLSGKAYLTDLKLDIPMNNVATFSGTLSLF